MRIVRLDLRAFGPFEGRQLDFNQKPGALHVIYGPNEAGKSSCLRAIRDWLYGIPVQTDDGFIHPYNKMRVGGIVECSTGEQLEFIRRKAKDKTMRGADDEQVIEPIGLTRMLGGVNRDIFQQRFCIGHYELERGGNQIAAGGGELSEILFAAGAGIAELPDIQKALDDETQKLFASRASTPTINASLKRLSDSRKQLKQLELSHVDWQRHQSELNEAVERSNQLEQQLTCDRRELKRCEQVQLARPKVIAWKQAIQILSDLKDVRLLPPDFRDRHLQARERCEAAEQDKRDAEREIRRLEHEIAQTAVPTAILSRRDAIDDVLTNSGSVRKALKDLPRLIAELRNAESDCLRILKELGWVEDLDQARSYKLTTIQRNRIQQLATKWSSLETRLSIANRIVEETAKELNQLESAPQPTHSTASISRVKTAVIKAQRHGDLEATIEEFASQLRELENRAKDKLDGLPLFNGSLHDLISLKVPLSETVDLFRDQMAIADDAIDDRVEQKAAYEDQLQNLSRELDTLNMEQDVPTEEDLQRVRSERDSGWQLVLGVWQGTLREDSDDVIAFVERWATSPENRLIAEAYRSSVIVADQIADRLRREADRVARKVKLTADLRDCVARIETAKAQLASAEQNKQQLLEQWQEQWKATHIAPRTPQEMSGWLRKRNELEELFAKIHQHQTKVDATKALVDELRRDIESNLPPREHGRLQTLVEWLDFGRQTIEAFEEATRGAQQLERDRQRLSLELEKAITEQKNTQRDETQWLAQWTDATAVLGLPEKLEPDQADAVLQTISELTEKLDTLSGLKERVAGIDRDTHAFSTQVWQLVGEVAPDVKQPGDPTTDWLVSTLRQRLVDATTAQTKLEGWKERLGMERSKFERASENVEKWRAEIDALIQLARCTSEDQLADAEQQSNNWREAETKKKQLQFELSQLAELAGSDDLASFVQAVGESDEYEIAAKIEQLRTAIQQKSSEYDRSRETVGGLRSDLNRMDGSAAAAIVQEDIENQLATIRSESEHYIRLRLASSLLRRSIERYRQSNQGPVLSRAGQMFGKLTLGAFSGLRADYDDQGSAVLVGVRRDGSILHTNHMSTGTRDQLYLALRLALLESHAEQYEPLPLIVDDILIHFDDERSTAALQLLAEMAVRTQVIFFTHHSHLVELAAAHLDEDQLAVYNLS